MKVLTKNGMKFAVGMFWQIPDKGRKTINLSKLMKDTGHSMYCQIGKYNASSKNFNLTYGFCTREGLQGEKKVASLGKFIIETSNLTAEYTNSIICYKFKDAGELDDAGKILLEDMFGYIVLLNGTICPDAGEYVAQFDSIKQAIIDQAHIRPIDTLYLPADVATRLLTLYERLDNAIYDDELLGFVLSSATRPELKDLFKFIDENFSASKFINIKNELLPYLKLSIHDDYVHAVPLTLKLSGLREIIRHEIFQDKVKYTVMLDKNIRYLISHIVQVPLTSDAIYWKNSKFKHSYNRALVQTIFRQTSKKYKLAGLFIMLGAFIYITYELLTGQELPLTKPAKPKSMTPKIIPLVPQQLITLCLAQSDRFFKDLTPWIFNGIKCDSLGVSYMFSSDKDTTLGAFMQLIGESFGVSLQGKNGIYTRKFNVVKVVTLATNLTRLQTMNNLQQAAIDYQFKLTIPTMVNHKSSTTTNYRINSKLSPIYLLSHGVLDGIRIKDISMTFDKNSGIYSWTIQGEF